MPGQQALFEVRQRHRHRSDLLLLFACYWQLGSQPQEIDPSLRQRGMGHACEWETSMMLRLAPHLVSDFSSIPPVSCRMTFEPASRGWTTKDRTDAGHIGNPAEATVEKGEELFQLFSNDVVKLLEQVIQWDGSAYLA